MAPFFATLVFFPFNLSKFSVKVNIGWIVNGIDRNNVLLCVVAFSMPQKACMRTLGQILVKVPSTRPAAYFLHGYGGIQTFPIHSPIIPFLGDRQGEVSFFKQHSVLLVVCNTGGGLPHEAPLRMVWYKVAVAHGGQAAVQPLLQ
jgi:hypothetical protein